MVHSKEKEWLYSNLLNVTLPEKIYVANTAQRFAGPVWAALRQAGGEVGPEWLLTSKRIISFRDLGESQWIAICSRATCCDTAEWSETDQRFAKVVVSC